MISATHQAQAGHGSLDLRTPKTGGEHVDKDWSCLHYGLWTSPNMTQPRGPSSGRPFAHPQRRGLLLPNGNTNLQTRCSHRASPYAQSRASPGVPLFTRMAQRLLSAGAGPALSTGTRIGRMRRCSFSTVACYRPTTACPSHQSHSRSVWPVQLLFFICGR